MGKTKTNNTNHSYYRAAERLGLNKEKARKMMREASRYGINGLGYTDDSDKFINNKRLMRYLQKKQYFNPHKRIKFYQGYVFVFCRTSTRCLTVYPAPYYSNKKGRVKDENN